MPYRISYEASAKIYNRARIILLSLIFASLLLTAVWMREEEWVRMCLESLLMGEQGRLAAAVECAAVSIEEKYGLMDTIAAFCNEIIESTR